ncbi:MAG: hypothetical protein MJE77_34605 [Proteobacteria bacterium]|nr:hypothetical protein [Pseudomonadota bacterium]
MNHLKYLDPVSTQTLRQGIAELRAAEGADHDAAENVAPELVEDIGVHDAVHVLFACPTNLAGEILAHVWGIFGTTMPLSDVRRVNRHEDHRSVLADIGHGRLVGTWIASIPQITVTIYRAVRMRHQWPASDFSSFLDRRLCDIRREFDIRLPKSPPRGHGKPGAALRTIRTPESV